MVVGAHRGGPSGRGLGHFASPKGFFTLSPRRPNGCCQRFLSRAIQGPGFSQVLEPHAASISLGSLADEELLQLRLRT